MSDLISREALVDKTEILYQHTESGKIIPWSAVRVCAINNIPTVEAEPVRHGEWVGTDFDGYADGNPVYYLWQCSCCHEEYERDGLPPWYDYCPNCGAKMDGGAENA